MASPIMGGAFATPMPALAPRRRVTVAATAAKGRSKEEKSLLDWVLGGMYKEEQLLETDPILKKVEEKTTTSGRATAGGRKGAAAEPPKKKGVFGLGGLFDKS